MKTTLLFSTIAIGVALTGCNKATRSPTASTDNTYSSSAAATAPEATTSSAATTTGSNDTFGAKVDRAGQDLSNAANSAADSMRSAGHQIASTAQMTEWHLNPSDIQADLDAKRDIVRTKDSAGTAPTGHMDRKTIKSAVEGRLNADADISTLKLDVNAKKDGEVELEGKAQTAEQVGKAIALALDTDGVTKVTSKVRLDKDAGR